MGDSTNQSRSNKGLIFIWLKYYHNKPLGRSLRSPFGFLGLNMVESLMSDDDPKKDLMSERNVHISIDSIESTVTTENG